jgi:putative membrane protein
LTEHGGVNAPGYGTQQSNPAGAPGAYEETGTATASSGQLAAGDAKFIDEASRNGQAEVKMGQLIAEDAADPDVKSYGQMLIDDHTKLNQQLDHLGSLSGADFNKAALKDAIRDHERDIRAFQDAAQKCQDPDVKSFAQQALPTLQQHLQRAKELDEMFSGHTT